MAENRWLPDCISPGRKNTGRPRVKWIKGISVEMAEQLSAEGNR
jgi:hypothetical protein